MAKKRKRPESIISFNTTFMGLRQASASRVKRWHGPKGVHDWSLTDWSNAAAGEMGEVCNAVKKLRRVEGKLSNRSADPKRRLRSIEAAKKVIGEEIADTIIYLDLLALRLNLDTYWEVANKFNKTSKLHRFPERLDP